MQFFYWIVLLIVIGLAVFAIQNSDAPQVTIRFLLWQIETSLVYTILGSIVLGVLITLLFWIPRAIRASFRKQKPAQEISSTKPSSLNG
jgi:uncharacterized integral membrane protein